MLYFIWGLNWVVMKAANQFFPPVLFVTYRFVLGAAVLLAVCAWLRIPLPPRKYWSWIALTGVLQVAANNVAAQLGMQTLGAGLVAVLNYSMPVWVAILAHFFLQEHLTPRKVLGIGMSMGGLFVLLQIDTYGSLYGILLTLSGAFAWAVAAILIKLKLQGCDMLQYTTWQLTAGAALLVLYSVFAEQGPVTWNAAAVECLLYNGILASAFAFFLWSYILGHMEAGKAAVAILAVPVVGVICGVFFLQEELSWNTALGMLLILAGILLVVMQRRRIVFQQHS